MTLQAPSHPARILETSLLHMKRLVTSLSTAALLSQVRIYTALAQFGSVPPIDDLPQNDAVGTESLITLILDIIQIILDVILVIAVLFVIIAGVRLIVSGGNEEQKDKAKQTIIYVIAGIIVILFARAIVTFVANLFI